MATYHKNLQYHEDTVTKRQLTDEDRNFLRELQKELNTQDTVCQADPRFWVIKGKEKRPTGSDYADGFELYNSDEGITIPCEPQDFAQYVAENIQPEIDDETTNYEISVETNERTNQEYVVVEWDEDEERCRRELRDEEEMQEWLEEVGYDYDLVPYEYVDKIYPDTLFLTQKDAEDHLRANSYHYDDEAHTYAMTAFRSPCFEKLLKILQEVEF